MTEIKRISIGELPALPVREGLILQRCGADLNEWAEGIDNVLTDKGILCDGDKFSDIYTFEHDNMTNMLFSMDNIKLDPGKMAEWQIASHGSFGGT